MQAESQSAGAKDQRGEETINCPNCHVQMPRELRFCRLCGFRLGEGLAEYVETVRLPNASQTAQRNGGPATSQAQGSPTDNQVRDWGAMASAQRGQALGQSASQLAEWKRCRPATSRVSWMVWLVIALIVFSVGGGFMTALLKRQQPARMTVGPRGAVAISPVQVVKTRSYMGTSDLMDADDGGAYFAKVSPPGSPADKAGLIGGDVIKSFDGQPVKNSEGLINILNATPIGKTVDVTYVRDGETKTTKLTTAAKDDLEKMGAAFDSRTEGRGQLGIDDGDIERVEIPGTKIHGVRVDVLDNRPADIAGMRDGDIIIEFNGTPIRTPEELFSRINQAVPRSTVNVVIIRDGERMMIPVKMGKK